MVSQKTFIIAEAGVNHNGDIHLAKKLIEVAAQAGSDAIKFQTFKADQLASRFAQKAEYQLKTTYPEESQQEMLRRLELSEEAHRILIDHCARHQILFLSSPFEEESVDFLDRLNVPLFKIPSGEITNEPFLKHVASKNKPIILSTGMSTLEEVKQAIQIIHFEKKIGLTLLHCVTEYPAPHDQINLKAMLTLHQTFGFPIGYSDHTEGIEIALAAVALGASVIEKHLTLDRNLPGPDHHASLEPSEFKQMVKNIRSIEDALGDGLKKPAPCEMQNRNIARKSLIAAYDLEAGTILTEEAIIIQRPGTGLPPSMRSSLLGRQTKIQIFAGTPIQLEMLT